MGLDCTHDAWHGAYSAFMRWRRMIATAAGLPPLDLMEGFYCKLDGSDGPPTLYHGASTNKPALGADSRPHLAGIDERLPIKWSALDPSPLHELLYHSDCEGEIAADRCVLIASALEAVIPMLPDIVTEGHIGNPREKTAMFVAGLRLAAQNEEPLLFR